LINKPKEIVDIDAGDANNELAAVEYLEDIYKFYKIVEVTITNMTLIYFSFYYVFVLCLMYCSLLLVYVLNDAE